MTTATESTARVPIRTWQEKAIVAAALASGMLSIEGIETETFAEDLLLSEPDMTERLKAHLKAWEYVEKLQRALRALESIEPRSDAWLEVTGGIDLRALLSEQVDYIAETDIDRTTVKAHPTRREWAQAVVVACDLRDELAGGDA